MPLSARGTTTQVETPLSRIRKRLQVVSSSLGAGSAARQSTAKEDGLGRDLMSLLGRLRRVQASGVGVELSPHLAKMLRPYRVVGNEMLVLSPAAKAGA